MHHILHGPITDFSLRQFIYNFTTRNLNRALENPKLSNDVSCKEQICIRELNTENFLPVVMQQHKVCDFCVIKSSEIIV